MKTSERIINALQRMKELLTLVTDWSKKPKEEDLLNKEFKEAKQKLIDDLYIKLGSLSDRYMFNHKSEFVTREYLVQYEELKKQIKELEK